VALDYEAVRGALAGERLPSLFVDGAAFDANIDRVAARARQLGLTVRVASKSLRAPALVRRVLERGAGALSGVMCFAAEEAALLAREGLDDLFVAYPPWQASDIETLARLTAEGRNVSVAVDGVEAIDRLSELGAARGVCLPVVLCVDMSLELLGGRVHLGVYRSPLRTTESVISLARHIAREPGVTLHGLMGYEAQIAGMGDDSPFDGAMRHAKRLVRSVSRLDVARRRSSIAAALRRDGHELSFVNGGGTGSLDSTTRETGVTEATAGSAFFKPVLFDHYRSRLVRSFEPSCFFALEVTRVPGPGVVTCLGGGYVASGEPGLDKVPLPWLPRGCRLLPHEMAGEVQTPVALPSDAKLRPGDPVVFRHAKGGEICERFLQIGWLEDGRIAQRHDTYRGLGACFL
jgi:D-serine deaminase-like pyridoxal phosphate-dependent protein